MNRETAKRTLADRFKSLFKRQSIDLSRLREVASDWSRNDYYDNAESQDWLSPFWSRDSHFRRLYETLDTSVLVELACGHGRHTTQILSEEQGTKPKKIFLLDVDGENIDYCSKRFSGIETIEIVKNNGYDFRPLKDSSVSAVFCYDAMVHFEYDCVISYIKDAYRVLKPGGRALFHHSGYDRSPGNCYRNNPHWRNFMSANLFSHVSQRNGFRVLEQIGLDWGGEHRPEKIDCLTLIEKPLEAPSTHPSLTTRLAAAIQRRLAAARNRLVSGRAVR